MTERQIGRYSVTHIGPRWLVVHVGRIVSEHSSKLHAITAAKRYDWCARHEKDHQGVTWQGGERQGRA
jgi:hypothetical protein